MASNFARAEAYIRTAAKQGAQLAVLPEYHLTGWAPDLPGWREVHDEATSHLAKYQALARELKVGIVPGTIVGRQAADSDKLVNVSYFIGPDGEVLGQYGKKNLWHPERGHLTADIDTPHRAFDTPWGRVGLLVCWDLAFPEGCRALAADGARIVVCPSFWLADDSGEGGAVNPQCEDIFLNNVCVARAIENTCAFVFVNTAAPLDSKDGRDANGAEYAGLSQLALPLKGSVGRLGKTEGMSLVDLDTKVLDVAENVYKVRYDMASENWHYKGGN